MPVWTDKLLSPASDGSDATLTVPLSVVGFAIAAHVCCFWFFFTLERFNKILDPLRIEGKPSALPKLNSIVVDILLIAGLGFVWSYDGWVLLKLC
jgi:hypothetical protein